MSNLETLLNENQAPAARSSLSARILTTAEAAQPANDVKTSRPWWAFGAMAAMALMAAFLVIQPMSATDAADSDVEWDQIADASGFSDLYEWVEGDDS